MHRTKAKQGTKEHLHLGQNGKTIGCYCSFYTGHAPNCANFEITVPLYDCDGFGSHFRITFPAFELLVAQLLSPSEHIPKGNALGRRLIEARRQIAVTVWVLASQETCRQISDRFDITMYCMSSMSRCVERVVYACMSSCRCSHRLI